jgi:hypothetical protein
MTSALGLEHANRVGAKWEPGNNTSAWLERSERNGPSRPKKKAPGGTFIQFLASNWTLYLWTLVFFLIAFPFHHIGLSGTLRSTNFFPFFPLVVRRGSGVLSPATHAHPLLSSILLFFSGRHETHTTQHPWEAIRPGIRTLLVVGGRVSLFLPPPYRQLLLDIHTHPWTLVYANFCYDRVCLLN